MSDAPKRLYLQTHDNPNDEFAWTHADHRIHDDDTEYVRADLVKDRRDGKDRRDWYGLVTSSHKRQRGPDRRVGGER